MQVHRLDHFTLRTLRLAETQAFYEHVIGLTPGDRPSFAFPGAWLYAQEKPLLHLAAAGDDAELQRYLGAHSAQAGAGCVDHITFRCSGLPAFEARLAAMDIAYDRRTVPALGEHQLFVTDPNGVRIECIFSTDEPASWTVDASGVAMD